VCRAWLCRSSLPFTLFTVEQCEQTAKRIRPATIELMADANASLDERLQEIGAQLDWVRDYL
jgi:hypothetical protein